MVSLETGVSCHGRLHSSLSVWTKSVCMYFKYNPSSFNLDIHITVQWRRIQYCVAQYALIATHSCIHQLSFIFSEFFGWENYSFICGLKHGIAIVLLYFNKCLLMNYLSGWCAVNLTLAAREEKIMKFIFCHWSWQIELWTSRLVVHLILCCSL